MSLCISQHQILDGQLDMVADTEVDMVTKKKYLIFILGVGSLLGGLFWCRADLGYFPPNLFWMGGNYPEGGFWLFSAPFAVNRGKLQFPPRQRAVFTRGLYIGVKILIWRNATVLLINDRSDNCILFFYFLPEKIVRLPCNCQLTNHARCVSVLSWEARKQTSRKSWASRKKLGWHRNHPAPHPDFVYKILPQTFYNQVLVSKKMNDPLCTDQVCFKKKFFSAATVKP